MLRSALGGLGRRMSLKAPVGVHGGFYGYVNECVSQYIGSDPALPLIQSGVEWNPDEDGWCVNECMIDDDGLIIRHAQFLVDPVEVLSCTPAMYFLHSVYFSVLVDVPHCTALGLKQLLRPVNEHHVVCEITSGLEMKGCDLVGREVHSKHMMHEEVANGTYQGPDGSVVPWFKLAPPGDVMVLFFFRLVVDSR